MPATKRAVKASPRAEWRCIREQFALNQGLKGKAVWSELRSRQKQTRKAVRQQDGLLFSRENSSNGVSEKTIRTFWQKSYWAMKVSVKEFIQNKFLCFQ